MKKSGTGSGGGLGSKNVVAKPQRLGTPARGMHSGGVSQLGSAVGNHITGDGGRTTNYRGDNFYNGKTPAGGKVPLGNQIANNVGKGGPGTGRQVHHCGSQGSPGPTRSPNASGRDILSEFGPDSSNARNRR
jgi:hypothetical protein